MFLASDISKWLSDLPKGSFDLAWRKILQHNDPMLGVPSPLPPPDVVELIYLAVNFCVVSFIDKRMWNVLPNTITILYQSIICFDKNRSPYLMLKVINTSNTIVSISRKPVGSVIYCAYCAWKYNWNKNKIGKISVSRKFMGNTSRHK